MSAPDDLNDRDVAEALDQLDEAREEGGPEAVAAVLQSLSPDLRARVEPLMSRILAAEDTLLAFFESAEALDGEDCGATGKTGRYEIIKMHAPGGMGVVYRARDVELDRVVAYKVMKRRYHDDPEARQRFQQEAQVTSRFQHSGIVPVLGFVQDEPGLPAYAMEFVEGPTLSDAIRQFHHLSAGDRAGRPRRTLNELLRHFIAACQVVA